MIGCPFCEPAPDQVFHDADPTVLCMLDAYPVTPGHALVIPRRHVPSWFDATRGEQASLLEGIEIARQVILARHAPAGFNIGINIGAAAGQTVDHLHVHVIPRTDGDVPDPRGGVRHVIPAKGNYLAAEPSDDSRDMLRDAGRGIGAQPVVVGSDRSPLAGPLLADLARAQAVDIAVAFIFESGLKRIYPYLHDILDRRGKVRVLVGDYMDATEPAALERLLDLGQGDPAGHVDCRVFQTDRATGFHPKAYILPGTAAYIGSSNLTRQGLEVGVEWNLRMDARQDPAAFRAVTDEFELLFAHRLVQPLTRDWIADYRERRPAPHLPHRTADRGADIEPEPSAAPPAPHAIQREALEALRQTRLDGNRAGLVVLATGLGKTWLSAFDSAEHERVLFVAHREEILEQARDTYRRIRPDSALGLYSGKGKQPDAEVLFASVQTLSRASHLKRFAPDAFDYIVVDEFHHACARTYRKLIDHFEPAFLLGLTATPDRSDGGNLLALCGENLVYTCDLLEGIRCDELVPFHYHGVPDDVEYANIPWKRGGFDADQLEAAVATKRRAQNALEQWRELGGERTLAFCVSQLHADTMARFFREAGVATAAVHSGPNSAPRAESLERLRDGSIQVLFAVDMFNEGVDVPTIDTVLMLRPTQSQILWLQQMGRGLRKADGKSHLEIIDYIGNHRTFLQGAIQLLAGGSGSPADLAAALRALENDELELPPGCQVTYTLEAKDILKGLIRISPPAEALSDWYRDFKRRLGVRPTATEAWHAGLDPKAARQSHGSWLDLVRAQGDLTEQREEALALAGPFLQSLETTPMTRSYKMLLLLGMIARDSLPSAITIDDLATAFSSQARRLAVLAADVGPDLDDAAGLRRLLEQNPIAAWVAGRGTGGTSYFRYEDGTFASTLDCPPELAEELRELVRELCEWRLAQYVERKDSGDGPAPRFTCRVSRNASGSPILFLPSRASHPKIPQEMTAVTIDGQLHEASIQKIAINVVRLPETSTNILPDILRNWFGPTAGEPGQPACRVQFEWKGGTYHARPLETLSDLPEPWSRVHTDDGTELDATFSIEPLDGKTTLVYRSRGGTRGQQGTSNVDYNPGLKIILARLASASCTILDAWVDSRSTEPMPLEKKRLIIPDAPYPLDLTGRDPHELRLQLGHAQATVGRRPDARGSGNATKRIRLVLGLPAGRSPDELRLRLAGC